MEDHETSRGVWRKNKKLIKVSFSVFKLTFADHEVPQNDHHRVAGVNIITAEDVFPVDAETEAWRKTVFIFQQCLISSSYTLTSVRQRRRPLHGYSPSAAYVRQRRRLQYGYGPIATYVRLRLWYISDAVSE